VQAQTWRRVVVRFPLASVSLIDLASRQAVPVALYDLASRQTVPVRGSYCDGHRLRGDFAALFGLEPAPANSLRALKAATLR